MGDLLLMRHRSYSAAQLQCAPPRPFPRCIVEQRACERKIGGACAVGQQPVVADAMETSGEYMQQEAAHKFFRRKRHDLLTRFALGAVVPSNGTGRPAGP